MTDTVTHWAVPAAIVLGGLIVGLLLERLVLVQLRRLLDRTSLAAPVHFVDAVKGAATELCVLVAAYVALPRMPLGEETARRVSDLLFVLVVFAVTLLAARIAGAVLRNAMERGEGPLPNSSIFVNIIKGVVLVLGALVVMQHFGISITPVLTALGVGGLAVALALQPTLSGLFSGLQILAAKQIRPGDIVQLENGQTGEVVDITWRNTIIRTMPDNMVIVPNETMASSIVTNYQLPRTEMSVLVECGVAYDSDLDHVEGVVLEVAREVVAEEVGEIPEWEPAIRFHTFGDSAIGFTAILRAREFRDQHALKHQFIKRLKKRFDEEGIEIPFPQRAVHIEGEKES
ncbi:MAG: mechanosensitive ion channel family protein [Coriobacteriia bacterium]